MQKFKSPGIPSLSRHISVYFFSIIKYIEKLIHAKLLIKLRKQLGNKCPELGDEASPETGSSDVDHQVEAYLIQKISLRCKEPHLFTTHSLIR